MAASGGRTNIARLPYDLSVDAVEAHLHVVHVALIRAEQQLRHFLVIREVVPSAKLRLNPSPTSSRLLHFLELAHPPLGDVLQRLHQRLVDLEIVRGQIHLPNHSARLPLRHRKRLEVAHA